MTRLSLCGLPFGRCDADLVTIFKPVWRVNDHLVIFTHAFGQFDSPPKISGYGDPLELRSPRTVYGSHFNAVLTYYQRAWR